MSIKFKILLILAAAVVGFVIYIAVNIWSLNVNKANLSELSATQFPAMQKTEQAIHLLARIEDQLQLAVTTGDVEQLEATTELSARLKTLLTDTGRLADYLRSDTNAAATLFDAYFTAAHSLSRQMIDGSADFTAIGSLVSEKASKLDAFNISLERLQRKQSEVLSRTVNETNDTSRFALLLGVGIGVATIVVLSIVAVSISMGVTGKLRSVTESLRDMTEGSGDLHKRIPITSSDEIGKLIDAFNGFIEKLQKIMGQVIEASGPLNSVVTELEQIIDDTKQQVLAQRDASSDASIAAAEVSENISIVSEHAHTAAQEADAAMERVNAGQSVFNTTAIAIEKLASDMETASTDVSRLEADTNSVGVILDVIRGIAEQTNLLALNAAIEAARAGEQGRGFAVVADEVRSLASKTQDSTAEIDKLIGQLQHNATLAAESMLKRTEQARESVQNALHANEHLKFVGNSMTNIRGISVQVKQAVNTEKELAERISNQVRRVDGIADKANQQTESLAKSSKELQTLAVQLQNITRQFTS